MYQSNKKFSLVAMILSLGFVAGASAAPSVRVLGAGSGSSVGNTAGKTSATKASGVNTGNNIKPNVLNASAGVKKSASVKTMSTNVANMQPVSRASSKRTGGSGTGVVNTGSGASVSDANRFPGIASKTNVQKSYAPSSTGSIVATDPSTKAYNIQEMTERIGYLESSVDDKATKVDLENYYTKEEIDTMNAGYYTSSEVDEKINSIDTSMSSPYIQSLVETIDSHTTEIRNLKGESQYIYDMNSGEKKSIYLVADFDENALFGGD